MVRQYVCVKFLEEPGNSKKDKAAVKEDFGGQQIDQMKGSRYFAIGDGHADPKKKRIAAAAAIVDSKSWEVVDMMSVVMRCERDQTAAEYLCQIALNAMTVNLLKYDVKTYYQDCLNALDISDKTISTDRGAMDAANVQALLLHRCGLKQHYLPSSTIDDNNELQFIDRASRAISDGTTIYQENGIEYCDIFLPYHTRNFKTRVLSMEPYICLSDVKLPNPGTPIASILLDKNESMVEKSSVKSAAAEKAHDDRGTDRSADISEAPAAPATVVTGENSNNSAATVEKLQAQHYKFIQGAMRNPDGTMTQGLLAVPEGSDAANYNATSLNLAGGTGDANTESVNSVDTKDPESHEKYSSDIVGTNFQNSTGTTLENLVVESQVPQEEVESPHTKLSNENATAEIESSAKIVSDFIPDPNTLVNEQQANSIPREKQQSIYEKEILELQQKQQQLAQVQQQEVQQEVQQVPQQSQQPAIAGPVTLADLSQSVAGPQATQMTVVPPTIPEFTQATADAARIAEEAKRQLDADAALTNAASVTVGSGVQSTTGLQQVISPTVLPAVQSSPQQLTGADINGAIQKALNAGGGSPTGLSTPSQQSTPGTTTSPQPSNPQQQQQPQQSAAQVHIQRVIQPIVMHAPPQVHEVEKTVTVTTPPVVQIQPVIHEVPSPPVIVEKEKKVPVIVEKEKKVVQPVIQRETRTKIVQQPVAVPVNVGDGIGLPLGTFQVNPSLPSAVVMQPAVATPVAATSSGIPLSDTAVLAEAAVASPISSIAAPSLVSLPTDVASKTSASNFPALPIGSIGAQVPGSIRVLHNPGSIAATKTQSGAAVVMPKLTRSNNNDDDKRVHVHVDTQRMHVHIEGPSLIKKPVSEGELSRIIDKYSPKEDSSGEEEVVSKDEVPDGTIANIPTSFIQKTNNIKILHLNISPQEIRSRRGIASCGVSLCLYLSSYIFPHSKIKNIITETSRYINYYDYQRCCIDVHR